MQQLDADGLPPLAPPTASDNERASAIVARMVARHGAPSIEDYRKGTVKLTLIMIYFAKATTK